MLKKRLTETGDTIVEVLIAMLVISVVLGGAFVTTNTSEIGVEDSQEHAEAAQLIESELEQLRANATGSSPTVFTAGTPFCMYNETVVSTSTSQPAADCVQSSAGSPSTAQPDFTLEVTRTPSNGGYLFSVSATWPEANGKGNANEEMVYRLYD